MDGHGRQRGPELGRLHISAQPHGLLPLALLEVLIEPRSGQARPKPIRFSSVFMGFPCFSHGLSARLKDFGHVWDSSRWQLWIWRGDHRLTRRALPRFESSARDPSHPPQRSSTQEPFKGLSDGAVGAVEGHDLRILPGIRTGLRLLSLHEEVLLTASHGTKR